MSSTTVNHPANVFLEGENLLNDNAVFQVILAVGNNQTKGTLYITNFRLYFESQQEDEIIQQPPAAELLDQTSTTTNEEPPPIETPEKLSSSSSSETTECCNTSVTKPPVLNGHHYMNILVIDVPLCVIHRIEKLNEPSSNSPTGFILQGILIICKNGRRLRFLKLPEQNQLDANIYNYFDKYAFPISNGLNYFAFDYKPTDMRTDGWLVYNAVQEYTRQGVTQSKHWRIDTELNKEYQLCETYPSVLVVPKTATDFDLREIAKFRSKGRVPVLSWLYTDNNDIEVALLRSSQPLTGLSGKRSVKDEEYLRGIAKQTGLLEIIDARPYLNAMANWTTGGGYEDQKYYLQCKVRFMQIDNIHAMRDSLNVSGDFWNLENSKWLEHVKRVLDGAIKIAEIINIDRNSVLVHCSDGWDRTSQLTALAMLILDKYYRTIQGFQVLIEKEWLSFGHCYEMRMGHGSNKHSDNDRSPIFVQFIDCVWQIMNQHSTIFEFNQKLLLEILHAIYTCQYGTFLYNSELERHKNDVKNKTVSLWSYINSNLQLFLNRDYVEYDSSLLKIDTNIPHLKIWSDYYFEYKELTDTCRVGSDAGTSYYSYYYSTSSPGGGGGVGGVALSSSSTNNANMSGSNSVIQDSIEMIQSLGSAGANGGGNMTSRIASGIFTSGYKIFNTVKSTLRN